MWLLTFFNTFYLYLNHNSNSKAVGSPASNLHTLDLESDLQRQPVTLVFLSHLNDARLNSYLSWTKCDVDTCRPLLGLLESKTWDHCQTYRNRWGHALLFCQSFAKQCSSSKTFPVRSLLSMFFE